MDYYIPILTLLMYIAKVEDVMPCYTIDSVTRNTLISCINMSGTIINQMLYAIC